MNVKLIAGVVGIMAMVGCRDDPPAATSVAKPDPGSKPNSHESAKENRAVDVASPPAPKHREEVSPQSQESPRLQQPGDEVANARKGPPLPGDLEDVFERIRNKGLDEEFPYETWRRVALADLSLTSKYSRRYSTQLEAIKKILRTRRKDALADVMTLFDAPIEVLFPEDTAPRKSEPCRWIMLVVVSNFKEFPGALKGPQYSYSREDVENWKRWWKENQDKLQYDTP